LFDGLHTVPYTAKVAAALPPSWSLAQAILSSSYTGWGTSSLQKDVEELSQCVAYFRSIKTGKIIIMGHSTGCQDVLEYLTGTGHEDRTPIDGGIIQAAVSDREAFSMLMDPETYKSSCVKAQQMVDDGDEDEILPSVDLDNSIIPCPVSAKRWLSLASPNHDGDDDYFSSDLTDAQLMKTFGSLPSSTPLCIFPSGKDEYVPPHVDSQKLLRRWIEIAKRGNGKIDEDNSAIIDGADHNLSGSSESVVSNLVERVVRFLNGI
jgi:hypothetical protein